MSSKIFASPGVSSRPLTLIERTGEWWKYRPPLALRARIFSLWWSWKNRHIIRELEQALAAGTYGTVGLINGEPPQVESLEATMKVVTFDAEKTRLQRRWFS